jgi:hypothetical protein
MGTTSRFGGLGRGGFTAAIFFLLCATLQAQRTLTVPEELVAYPDMIVYNAKLVTMDDPSFGLNAPIGTIAQAMAIRQGKVQAVGANDRIVSLAGPKTEKIDAKGRMVMPGIINTHTHIHNNEMEAWVEEHPEVVDAVASNYSVGGKTDAEMTQGIKLVVQEHVRKTAPGRWAFITVAARGGGGSGLAPGVAYLAQAKFNKQMLDQLAPQHPVMLMAHPSYVANSAFVAGVEKLNGTKFSSGAGGMDEQGRVKGTAPQYRRGLIIDQYFQTRVPLLADIVAEGLLRNAAAGITAFASHIMGLRFLDAFNLLDRQNRMPIRFAYTHYFGFQAGYQEAANFYRRMGDMAGMGSDFLWQSAVGLGSIDSGPPRFCSTMEAPKAVKDGEWCQNSPGTIQYETTRTAIANYERIAVGHAYADKGVDYFMDAVDQAMQDNPAITMEYIRSRRFSSDHCGFYPRKEQLPRMAEMGMMISCSGGMISRSFPYLKIYNPIYEDRIAPIKSAIQGGVMVTLEGGGASRNNVGRSPFAAGANFLHRKNEYGVVVAPKEIIDRNTLLKMMTSWAARYVLRENVLGTLEPGKWADFIVLNKDYFDAPIDEVKDIYPLMTVVGGNIRVLRAEYAQELGRRPLGPQVDFKNENQFREGAD